MVTDLVKCADRPCLNGGNCTDSRTSYTCKCVVGYDGWNCENSKYTFNWDTNSKLEWATKFVSKSLNGFNMFWFWSLGATLSYVLGYV